MTGTEGVHGDVLAVWQRNYATNAYGGALPCGHYVPEEAPEETLSWLLRHFDGDQGTAGLGRAAGSGKNERASTSSRANGQEAGNSAAESPVSSTASSRASL